jgi:hypothetical protein
MERLEPGIQGIGEILQFHQDWAVHHPFDLAVQHQMTRKSSTVLILTARGERSGRNPHAKPESFTTIASLKTFNTLRMNFDR